MTSAPTGHPRGIYTLFFTEMWERFSYYGMRALLVLYMVAEVNRGGMGLTDEMAAAIYGLYTALVYMTALPGGWVGDRLLGAKEAVWWGGIIIAIGHVVLAIHSTQAFFIGLILVAFGSGLLKSNMSALVGQLYPEGGSRRDAGFTLFYMGINVGALFGQLLCGWLGEEVGWRWGFSAAAVGMFLGLVQFKLTHLNVAHIGQRVIHEGQNVRREWTLLL
ncbi:peptide MFS transporter, partial [Prosthecobacter sp.]|uniref:peptide MFS transporter n=1 Tax=Prosthecobacter sp. TaxID=1965333 RepID=UPI002488A30D